MKLMAKAAEVLKNAYAPYSKFYVACAVVGNSGKIYTGTNVENACINAGTCAERVAIGYAISQGETKITHIAIINKSERPCPPCGMCLQFMNEFVQPDTEILTANGDQTKTETYKFSALLPITYDRSFLPGNR